MVVPLDQRPRSGPYSGLNANSAKRFLTAQFTEAGLPTPDIDAKLLVMAATGFTPVDMITRGTEFLSQEAFMRISDYAARRVGGEPVDHILAIRGFYGRDFWVTLDVLSPRPDSETLIDCALEKLRGVDAPRILDLGTGSGALAVTLLAEIPRAHVQATDISPEALHVAAENAQTHNVSGRISFMKSDWLQTVGGHYDLIISNPPYIDAKAMGQLSDEVLDYDPRIALYGGEDGLDPYRVIMRDAPAHLNKDGWIILEIGYDQGVSVPDILRAAGFINTELRRDLGGQPRCISAQYSP